MEGSFGQFEKSPELYQYSLGPMGYSFGNPVLDTLGSFFLKDRLAPRPAPHTTQSVYDAYLLQQQSYGMSQARNEAMSKQFLAKRMGGLDPNSWIMQMAMPMIGGPDGLLARSMAPFIGGNPIKAQMGLLAGMSGQTMGTFGRVGGIDVGTSTMMMDTLYKDFYTTRDVTPKDKAKYKQQVLEHIKQQFPGQMGDYAETALNQSEPLLAFQRKFGTELNTPLRKLAQGLVGELESAKPEDKAGIRSKYEKKGLDLIDSQVTDQGVKNKLTEVFSAAIKDGSKLGLEAFDKELSASAAKVGDRIGSIVHMLASTQPIPIGINFAKTRGFQIEDITSAFMKASDLRMISGRGGLRASQEGFQENAISALDMARGVYGQDKTGAQLMTAMSDLLGTSTLDLQSEGAGGGRGMEDLLNKVKATAKVAGISIESMLGIIQQGKELIARHPELGRVGGIYVTQAMVGTVRENAALNATMGSEYMRWVGGPVGQQNILNAQAGNNTGQAGGKMLAALASRASSMGDTAALEKIKKFATDPNNDLSQTSPYSDLINQLGADWKINPYALRQYAMTNSYGQSKGMDVLAGVGVNVNEVMGGAQNALFGRLYQSELMRTYGVSGFVAQRGLQYAFSGKHITDMGELTKYISPDGQPISEADRAYLQQLNDAKANKVPITAESLVALNGLSGSVVNQAKYTNQHRFKYLNDDKYKATYDNITALGGHYEVMNKRMNEKLGYLSGPTGQLLVSGLFKEGGLDKAKLTDLFDLLRLNDGTPEGIRTKGYIDAVNNISLYHNDPTKQMERIKAGYALIGVKDVDEVRLGTLAELNKDYDLSAIRSFNADDDATLPAKLRNLEGKTQIRNAQSQLAVMDKYAKSKKLEPLQGKNAVARTAQRDVFNDFGEFYTSGSVKLSRTLANETFNAFFSSGKIGLNNEQLKQYTAAGEMLYKGLGDMGALAVGSNGEVEIDYNKVGSVDKKDQLEKLIKGVRATGGEQSERVLESLDQGRGSWEKSMEPINKQLKDLQELIDKQKTEEKTAPSVVDWLQKNIGESGLDNLIAILKQLTESVRLGTSS